MSKKSKPAYEGYYTNIQNEALYSSELNDCQFRVYSVLKQHCDINSNGFTWIGNKSLTELTGKSERVIQKAIKVIFDLKLLIPVFDNNASKHKRKIYLPDEWVKLSGIIDTCDTPAEYDGGAPSKTTGGARQKRRGPIYKDKEKEIKKKRNMREETKKGHGLSLSPSDSDKTDGARPPASKRVLSRIKTKAAQLTKVRFNEFINNLNIVYDIPKKYMKGIS